MTRRGRWAAATAVATVIAAVLSVGASRVSGCGPFLTFRAYLKRSFWQPARYVIEEGVNATGPAAAVSRPYAGFVKSDAPGPLARLRLAYSRLADGPLSYSTYSARDEAEAALREKLVESARKSSAEALAPGALQGAALAEARLLDAKVDLRAAEADSSLLPNARRKMDAFLAAHPSPAFASEARGWLARILYLQGDGVGAAKIYLDELDAPASTMSRTMLANSLRTVYVHGEQQFWDRAEELFDTPRHALLVLNLLTNPTNFESEEVPAAEVGRRRARILALLAKHEDLFRSGADSDTLAMASMRVAIFGGDLDAALRFSRGVGAASALRDAPEFNWLVASAYVMKGEQAGAEAPLLRMLNAAGATGADRRSAAQALAGVYFAGHRPVEALHASFIQETIPDDDSISGGPEWPYRGMRPQWCIQCRALDLPYMLDAWLTDGELLAYLKKYPAPVTLPEWYRFDRHEDPAHPAPNPTDRQMVRYALAVRYARARDFQASERIYRELGVANRAARMQKLGGLWARAQDGRLAPAEHWQAVYDYAVYLAANQERLFFNDSLWFGYQQWALHEGWAMDMDSESGLSEEDLARVAATDRRLRDEQEEQWQAYKALLPVAREAPDPVLRKKAVIKMLDCLPLIATERFGRAAEIDLEIKTWLAWLKQQKRK